MHFFTKKETQKTSTIEAKVLSFYPTANSSYYKTHLGTSTHRSTKWN